MITLGVGLILIILLGDFNVIRSLDEKCGGTTSWLEIHLNQSAM
jgi:hypothetical protein